MLEHAGCLKQHTKNLRFNLGTTAAIKSKLALFDCIKETPLK